MFGEWRVFTESRFSMKDWNLGSTGLNPLKIAIETKKPLGAGGGERWTTGWRIFPWLLRGVHSGALSTNVE